MSSDHATVYSSFAGFFHETYGHAIIDAHRAGRTGAELMRTEQGPGDWSDAAVPDLTLTMVRSGEGSTSFDLGAGRFDGQARAHNWILVAPDTATTVLCDGPHTLSILSIPYAQLFALAGEGSRLPRDGDFGALHRGLNHGGEVSQLMVRLEARIAAIGSALYADGALLQLAAALVGLRHHPSAPSRLEPVAHIGDWRIRRAVDHLLADLAADVGLVAPAREVGLSPSHFARAFTQATGMPPHRWLTVRRVERACELLADPSRTITDIAYTVGFASPQHFATTFKQHVRMTPSGYRRHRLG
jgi:AraC family transcriptional regulator